MQMKHCTFFCCRNIYVLLSKDGKRTQISMLILILSEKHDTLGVISGSVISITNCKEKLTPIDPI